MPIPIVDDVSSAATMQLQAFFGADCTVPKFCSLSDFMWGTTSCHPVLQDFIAVIVAIRLPQLPGETEDLRYQYWTAVVGAVQTSSSWELFRVSPLSHDNGAHQGFSSPFSSLSFLSASPPSLSSVLPNQTCIAPDSGRRARITIGIVVQAPLFTPMQTTNLSAHPYHGVNCVPPSFRACAGFID